MWWPGSQPTVEQLFPINFHFTVFSPHHILSYPHIFTQECNLTLVKHSAPQPSNWRLQPHTHTHTRTPAHTQTGIPSTAGLRCRIAAKACGTAREESLIELQNTLIMSVSHIPALNASRTIRATKGENNTQFQPRVQLQGNYHQAPVHLCTNNPTAAGIDTVYAEESRESTGRAAGFSITSKTACYSSGRCLWHLRTQETCLQFQMSRHMLLSTAAAHTLRTVMKPLWHYVKWNKNKQ